MTLSGPRIGTLVILLLALLPAVGPAAPAGEPLIVASDRAWPPFSYLDEQGEPRGLLVDYWRALGDSMGRPVEFRLVDWQESLDLVRNGEADLHAGLFQSPQREAYLDFSDDLLPLSTRLFVSSQLKAGSMEALREVPVGITAGGFEQEFVRERYPFIKLRPYANNRLLVRAAIDGEVLAFVADYPVGMYYLHKLGSPEQFRVVDTLYTKYLKSAVAEGQGELLDAVNRALGSFPGDERDRIVQKWILTEQVMPGWLVPLLLSAAGGVLVFGTAGYATLLRRQVRRRTAELSREVEERTAVERTLRESEESYRNLFHSIRDAIYIHDLAGRFIAVNEAVTEMYGQPAAALLGQTPEQLAAPGRNDMDAVRAAWQKAVEGAPQRFEFWGRRANGEVFPKEVVVNPGRYDGQPVVIAVGRDISEVKETQRRLEEMAYLDPLTRLPNRRMLADRMGQAMSAADRSGSRLAVCYLDLDRFKPINDAHGHEAGDRLLVAVAGRLASTVRTEDTVARLGGDEFVVLIGGIDDTDGCTATLDRLLKVLAQQAYEVEGQSYRLSASIGVTIYPDDEQDADTLLRHADQAMYLAKQAGRDRYHFFDPQRERKVHQRREQLLRVRQAIAEDELCLYYQPKVDMRRGRVVGVEALVRWRHPERGILAPAEFLPFLDDELMLRLDAWVLRDAIAQLSRWRRNGLELGVSINVSASFLQQPAFIDQLSALLEAHPQVGPQHVELEILETAAVEDLDLVSAVIATCAEQGIAFALDDFGTGYSSLTYFRRLPARVLKVDQSFVRDMLVDADDRAIVEGIVRLAQVFGREVIAEGVETHAHGAALLSLGCELGQGYGIARPMPADEVPGWVAAFEPPVLWSSTAAVGDRVAP